MLVSEAKPHLIVTVHGIRTFGKWQERLEQLVRNDSSDEDTEFCHFKLGYFSLFAFLIPPLRWLVVRRFRNELRDLIMRTKRFRVDLVGHSFGTHVIGWALWGLRLNEDISIRFNGCRWLVGFLHLTVPRGF